MRTASTIGGGVFFALTFVFGYAGEPVALVFGFGVIVCIVTGILARPQ